MSATHSLRRVPLERSTPASPPARAETGVSALPSPEASASRRPPQAGAAPTPNPCQVLARDVHYRFEHFQKLALARRQCEFLGLERAATRLGRKAPNDFASDNCQLYTFTSEKSKFLSTRTLQERRERAEGGSSSAALQSENNCSPKAPATPRQNTNVGLFGRGGAALAPPYPSLRTIAVQKRRRRQDKIRTWVCSGRARAVERNGFSRSGP